MEAQAAVGNIFWGDMTRTHTHGHSHAHCYSPVHVPAHTQKGGHGVPKDEKQSLKYYEMAALQGHAGAQFNIGKSSDNAKMHMHEYACNNFLSTHNAKPVNKLPSVQHAPRTHERVHMHTDIRSSNQLVRVHTNRPAHTRKNTFAQHRPHTHSPPWPPPRR